MKNIPSLLLLVGFTMLWACSGKKEEATHEHGHEHKHEAAEAWKEMDDFHMVMAEAFHPYMDSSNLEPAKASVSILAEHAAKWAASPIPEKKDAEKIKPKLEQLSKDAAAFAETVKAGDDKKIADELTKLHDLFHEIQEEWYGGHGEHHHQH
ncbi:MAG TPA: hypothetical protein VGK59_08135 [Ohtaekwangia sp.]